MKKIYIIIAALLLSSCATYSDIAVRLTDVEQCPGGRPSERVGNCYIQGVREDGMVIKGPIFTMGSPGQWVLLRCGPNARCLPTATIDPNKS